MTTIEITYYTILAIILIATLYFTDKNFRR